MIPLSETKTSPEDAPDEEEEESLQDRIERMVIVFSVVFVAFIMLNPEMRSASGEAVALVMNPLFRLGGGQPILTLLGAGITMVVISTAVRHYFIDWMEMARVQKVMKSFQSEFKEARKNDNHYKVDKLSEVQPEVMQLQAKVSGGQLKPMAVTMLVVIPIFVWLRRFVRGLSDPTVAMPWTQSWSLVEPVATVFGQQLPGQWILLYSLFSIPFGQVIKHGLKLWDFRNEESSAEGA